MNPLIRTTLLEKVSLETELGFPGSLAGKEFACNAGDPGSIAGWGKSPGEGIGYSLQYSWASLKDWRQESNPKAFVFRLCHHQKIKNFQILPCKDDGQTFFSLDNGNTRFSDLIQLVDFYQLKKGSYLADWSTTASEWPCDLRSTLAAGWWTLTLGCEEACALLRTHVCLHLRAWSKMVHSVLADHNRLVCWTWWWLTAADSVGPRLSRWPHREGRRKQIQE